MPISISAGSHSLTVPWHLDPVPLRFNPAFVIGTERTLRDRDRWRLYHTGNAGFFQNYWWVTGAYLESELGASLYLPWGFHGDLRVGAGYLHYFSRRAMYELKDGRYVPATDWGKPAAIFPLSLLIGYSGDHRRPNMVSPFVSFKWAIQTPFSDETPAMTHFMILGGVRIFPGGRPRRRE